MMPGWECFFSVQSLALIIIDYGELMIAHGCLNLALFRGSQVSKDF